MLSNLKNVFKVADLRNKILFTLGDDRRSTGSAWPSGCPASTSRPSAAPESARVAGRARLPQPVLRRRVRQLLDLRARHHAVHHGQHHHAGPRRGHPQAGEVAAGRRGRPAQDHPVHPLPGDRHRHAAGHRSDVHLRQRPRQRVLRRGAERPRRASCCPTGMWPRGYLVIITLVAGTAAADVDRRADQPARHRQRHDDDHLRLGRVSSLPYSYYSILQEQEVVRVRRCWWR